MKKTIKVVPVGRWILCEKETNDYKNNNSHIILTKASTDFRMSKGTIVNMGTKTPKNLVETGDVIYSPDSAVVSADLYGRKYFFLQPENILGKEVEVVEEDHSDDIRDTVNDPMRNY